MSKQVDPAELAAFQSDLKLKLRYFGSFLSIVLIIFGLYLLVNGLFNMINSAPQKEEDEISFSGELPVCPAPEEKRDEGMIAEGIMTVKAQSFSAQEKAQRTAQKIAESGRWQATDYVSGDIEAGSYTVQLGDTLWEIAEAVYGSGIYWNKILSANSDAIAKLPNGEQALIIPGQQLIIPQ